MRLNVFKKVNFLENGFNVERQAIVFLFLLTAL